MGDVLVKSGAVEGGRITRLSVSLHGLGDRDLDRDAALKLMRDGHSFIPMVAGKRGPVMQVVEVDDAFFMRGDTALSAEDSLPEGL